MTTTTHLLKANTPRKELFEGIQTVGRAVATRSSLPILWADDALPVGHMGPGVDIF